MTPAPNPYRTNIIGAPGDGSMPECGAIEATVAQDAEGRRVYVTAWEPSEEELAAMLRGEKVWLTIWANGLPPASIVAGPCPLTFPE